MRAADIADTILILTIIISLFLFIAILIALLTIFTECWFNMEACPKIILNGITNKKEEGVSGSGGLHLKNVFLESG